ncbi:SRPBCC domain-containing protein [Actinacidiphila bryophytorum]|uniref:ATPase n=1 Tax=Actinacidiphila bryophytorum TaxID=1436133 RepID=A0A9W4H1N5_9ACTN|nr:SRPBCC domain-containing protein [Actinacidiphila bryophytorum]MBM9435046.1 SRPBCC domain-containing protein [Actinacidiphila bryophytorum]MBN6544560.1 SRPBCC domain-containing protein [Actinacidiphila bryophytorum]CAG7642734.1 ATPase [Actinacidiphila bryophytorum]
MNEATNGGEATVSTQGRRPVVRLERVLARPPEAVWRAITDPEELKAWFPCGVIADSWKPGAAISFPFAGGPTLTGVVLEVDEPHVLAYTWGEETLRFTLTPEPDGRTRLVLTDELDSPFAARNAAGWQVCLARLTGDATAGDAWQEHFARYTAAFEPALGPQEGPPAGH